MTLATYVVSLLCATIHAIPAVPFINIVVVQSIECGIVSHCGSKHPHSDIAIDQRFQRVLVHLLGCLDIL